MSYNLAPVEVRESFVHYLFSKKSIYLNAHLSLSRKMAQLPRERLSKAEAIFEVGSLGIHKHKNHGTRIRERKNYSFDLN